ncbi:MAG: branched-chain amino acid ABC transporter permease [Anaerolineales bacterium]|nr:branched-chain amino acid ABC transporter permease [Anaerolineales bacterium]
MMMKKDYLIWIAIKTGLLSGVIAIFLCLIGMVEVFSKRDVIEKIITLGDFILLATAVSAGVIAARATSNPEQQKQPLKNLIAGALAGITTGVVIAAFIGLSQQINLRSVFLSASPSLFDLLTFKGGTNWIWMYPAIGMAAGLLGTILFLLPEKFRQPITRAIFITFLLALFSGLFRVVMINQSDNIAKAGKYLFGQTGLTLSGAIIFFVAVVSISMFWSAESTNLQKGFARIPKKGQTGVRVVVFAILAYMVLMLPQVSGPFIAQVIVIVSLYALMGLGLNITLGFAGLLDLGFVAFFAVGAYTVGLLTSYGIFGLQHVSFWVAVPIAVLVSMMFGAFLGLPVLGVRGDYLAIATLGFGEIVRLLAGSDFLAPFFGGPQGIIGIQKPCLGTLGEFVRVDVPRICNGLEFAGPKEIYYLAVASAILIAFIALRLQRSRLGRAWMAIREDEDVAEALGINLIQTKLLAYMLGAAFAGLGGAIFTVLVGSIFATSMQLIVSINVVSLIIVGGMGSVPGVIVGAIALIGLPELLREVSEYRFLFYGAALIMMMLAKPEGLWPSQATLRELHHDDSGEDSEIASTKSSQAKA